MKKSGFLAVIIALLSSSHAAEGATLPMGSLFCGGIATEWVDAQGYPVVTKASLRRRSFTAWILYGSRKKSPSVGSSADMKKEWPLGFQLDNGPLAGAHLLSVAAQPIAMALSFSNLATGAHRLRIGSLNPAGDLLQENRYCFRVPGNSDWVYH
jgi:hypothetical protein